MAFQIPEHANDGEVSLRRPPAYLEKGDIFRILGMPDKFILGLDTMAMTTSRSLSGFRDIPPGPHFLWVQQPGGVSRCGYWFMTGPQGQGLVRTKEWNGYDEVLGETTQSEAAKQRDDMETIYPTLQPYPLHDHREESSRPSGDTLPDWAQSPASLWNVLTSAISTQTLSRITGKPDANEEYLVDSIDCAKDTSRDDNPSAIPKAPLSSAINELNFLFTRDFHDLQVLDLDRTTKTRVADTSARVDALLTSTTTTTNNKPPPPPTEQDILAELQFTFLTGTHLSNPACLSQWWNLVLKIVLRAHRLAASRPRLTAALLRTLHAQLLYTEHYFGDSSSSQPGHGGGGGGGGEGLSGERPIFEYKPLDRGRLRGMLVEYKRRLGGMLSGGGFMAEQEAVGRAWEELEAWLWRLGWDLRGGGEDGTGGSRRVGGEDGDMEAPPADSEDEEDEQPVVVELDGEGREVGLVSFRD
jgi:A1 cistron-splicing factor AAR2